MTAGLVLAAFAGVLVLRPDSPPVIAGVPVEAASPLPPVVRMAEPTAAALMQQALEAEAADPARAAILYARAALRGSDRAAYFLGQLHETGQGGRADATAARQWYAHAADLAAAQRRLQALPDTGTASGPPPVPIPVFQALTDRGSEMIWRMPEGAPPARYLIETFTADGAAAGVTETAVPALAVSQSVSGWRVTAIGADGRDSAPSPLVRMVADSGGAGAAVSSP